MHEFPAFPTKLLNELQATNTRLQQLRSDYEKLRAKPLFHFAQLQALADQLRELQGKYTESLLPQLNPFLESVAQALETVGKNLRANYGAALHEVFAQNGRSLSGHYPLFFSGFFSLEVEVERGRAILWFGHKQEKLASCDQVAPDYLLRKLQDEEQSLGSQLPPEKFFPKLVQAYDRVRRILGKEDGVPVPIISVLLELNFLLQNPRFLKDPQSHHFRPYRRADFAYDLYQVSRHERQELFPKRLRLVVARREQTKHPDKILWVPEDATGKGSVYAQLSIEEGGVA
ncbi:MAG: hypothetical protein NZ869_09780 [Thermoanaerobaculum sp.]|nr:hypothetical protein [Thermoanaerobaculum sp.]MDW7966768.1 hypothetical protein [Thermoanaerobaculum sp.]